MGGDVLVHLHDRIEGKKWEKKASKVRLLEGKKKIGESGPL